MRISAVVILIAIARNLGRGGARCWGVGGWYRMSALPGIGTPHRVPPERKHNRLWRERRDRLIVGLIYIYFQHIPQKKKTVEQCEQRQYS